MLENVIFSTFFTLNGIIMLPMWQINFFITVSHCTKRPHLWTYDILPLQRTC